MDADVIVVGGGPAGSSAALRLARGGHRVLLLDRARFPRVKPCGEYLNPTAVAALEALGVAEDVAALGVSLSGMYVAGPDGAAFWAPFASGRGLLIPRDRLDQALVAQARRAGVEVVEEFRVDGVGVGTAPTVTGRHQGRVVTLMTRLVVGADGVRSVAARTSGQRAVARGGHYTIGAHYEDLAVQTPRGDLHLGAGWYAGAALYGGGRGNVVVALPRGWFQGDRRRAEDAFAAAVAGLPRLAPLLRRARRVTLFVAAGPLGYLRRRAADDGLLLAGDAAGTVNPMTGEGIALALRGGALAAKTADAALRGGAASRAALAGYERALAAAFADTWRFSRLLQWIVGRPALAAALLRRVGADQELALRLLGTVSQLAPARTLVSWRALSRLLAVGG